MNIFQQLQFDELQHTSRRHFLKDSVTGLGAMFLASQGVAWGGKRLEGPGPESRDAASPVSVLPSHFPGKAKRVIFLNMEGAPSQHELFDYKPALKKYHGTACPQEYLEGKRFAFISGVPKLLGPQYPFHQAGKSGAWISDRLPHFEKVIDDVSFIKSMRTDQFNHAPAQLLMQTGEARIGKPSFGSWSLYGLGTENQNLPGYVVLLSGGKPSAGKAAWGAGGLPSVYHGVQCRSKGDPVLYLSNPDGVTPRERRMVLDSIERINKKKHAEVGDPETLTRIAQYETAFRMQMTAAEVMDLSKEPKHIHELYGTNPGRESFANNCLLARRLAENGVRFIQLHDSGWDSHGNSSGSDLMSGCKNKCRSIDKAIAGLITDLKQRGMYDDTLIAWGGEFGRTPMQENRGGGDMKFVGRDHNPGCFTIWMAGGAVKSGVTYGETDEIGYEVAKNPLNICDLHATLLHMLGMDHHKLSIPVQGLDVRLTGVHKAKLIRDILA